MNIKFTSTYIIILVLLFSSSMLYSQQSQSDHPQSSRKNQNYKNQQTHNSKLNKTSNINHSKRKDFTINRKQTSNENRKSQRNNSKKELTNGREKQNTTRSDNYFHIDKSGNALWDGKHWDLDEYPLKVYVKESSSRYYKSGYKDYVDYAFSVWQKADDRIKYTFTNNSRNADVEFVFVENLGKKYEENYLGLTEYDTNSENEIEFSKVQISLLKFGKEKISAGEIKATIVHELGHVLGLGHSKSETDIMYPYISSDHSYKLTYDELSRGDKEAIKDAIDLGEDQFVWK